MRHDNFRQNGVGGPPRPEFGQKGQIRARGGPPGGRPPWPKSSPKPGWPGGHFGFNQALLRGPPGGGSGTPPEALFWLNIIFLKLLLIPLDQEVMLVIKGSRTF